MNEVVLALTRYLRTRANLDNFVARVNSAALQLSGNDLAGVERYLTLAELGLILGVVKSIEDLRVLRDHLAGVEIFTMQISFPPNAYYESQLVARILESIKEPCVVQILTVRNLMAGAIVDYKGKYRDYSLKNAIEDWRKKKALHV